MCIYILVPGLSHLKNTRMQILVEPQTMCLHCYMDIVQFYIIFGNVMHEYNNCDWGCFLIDLYILMYMHMYLVCIRENPHKLCNL